MVTSIDQLDSNKAYTYSDYITWQIKERLEIIKGKILQMAAPSTRHQRISGHLHVSFVNSLSNKGCEIFSAPFDVRILPNTVVQPDLCIICDPSKLDNKGCVGAPDLIVEILSPSNSKTEMKYKFDIYEEAGVKEYWVVFPQQDCLIIYALDEHNKYRGLKPYTEDDIAQSTVLSELSVDMKEILK